MQLEEAKKNIKNRLDDIKEYIEYGMPYSDYLELQTSFETVLKYIDNSIPKQVIKEKIKENKGYLEHANTAYEYTQREVIEEVIKTLQGLQNSQVTIK